MTKAHEGMKIATKAIGSTIGPKGRNVFLANATIPRFTNDGASIANDIVLHDKEQDAGAWVIRSATARTADEVGDQTSTTAVIAEALFDAIQGRSEPAVAIKHSLYKALDGIKDKIRAASRTTTLKDIRHIAEISAEHKELAGLITDIFEKKGAEAQITVQDSGTSQCSIEMKDGYEAKVGMMSPWFVTNFQKQTAEYKDVPVLVTHKKIDAITQLLPLYERLSEKKLSKLVIVTDDIDIAALGAIVDNKRRGTFSTLVIRATGELLDDIASVVGAVPVADSTGTDFADTDLIKKLGIAVSVVSTTNTTTTQGTSTFVGKTSSGKQRAQVLESQAENVSNGFEKSAILKRAGKLRSGVAVLSIGAYSEQELGYLRDKADDAIKAVRAALEEGYVEGGGLTLYRIAESLDTKSTGNVLLKQALKEPFKRIVENSGEDYAAIVQKITKTHGYDAKENTFKDLVKAGIIDPAKGARVAVESAVSAIAELIVTSTLITDYVETKTS